MVPAAFEGDSSGFFLAQGFVPEKLNGAAGEDAVGVLLDAPPIVKRPLLVEALLPPVLKSSAGFSAVASVEGLSGGAHAPVVGNTDDFVEANGAGIVVSVLVASFVFEDSPGGLKLGKRGPAELEPNDEKVVPPNAPKVEAGVVVLSPNLNAAGGAGIVNLSTFEGTSVGCESGGMEASVFSLLSTRALHLQSRYCSNSGPRSLNGSVLIELSKWFRNDLLRARTLVRKGTFSSSARVGVLIRGAAEVLAGND